MRPTFKHFLLCILTLSSCATNDNKQEVKTEIQHSTTDTTKQSHSAQTNLDIKNIVRNGDTLTIDRKSAVFFQPDSLQMEERMKKVGEKDFRAGADDYIYYINISAEFLEKQGLPVMNAKGKKYLKFVTSDKKAELVKLDTLSELWGMYLFDPEKKPHYADIIEIEDDYKNYFK
ncbi:hypothetical protein EFY79_21050 [Hanamia caeni]|jgi:hypothetical protein|uniref:Lipoprotein n=1 Tax=Hanamia caeni TaxID=2294116 RepID=A0A3M9N211_9BACT|nr:hypothetical protein [Hanamia caeni]RNI31832.1 hypothetical protein EFY79_21050 [Hanamia caeni]